MSTFAPPSSTGQALVIPPVFPYYQVTFTYEITGQPEVSFWVIPDGSMGATVEEFETFITNVAGLLTAQGIAEATTITVDKYPDGGSTVIYSA